MSGLVELDDGITNDQTAFNLTAPVSVTIKLFLVDDELIKIVRYDDAGTSDTVDECVRGFGNSVAASHDSGTECYQVVGVIGSGDAFTVNYIDIEEGSSTVVTRAINSGGGGGSAPVVLAEFAGYCIGGDGSSVTGNEGAGGIEDDIDNPDTYVALIFNTEEEDD